MTLYYPGLFLCGGMHYLIVATLCRTKGRKRQPAEVAQTTRKRSKKAPAAATSPRGPIAIHQGLGLELPSVHVETMDEDGHAEAATVPISAFASATMPHASLAATKPLAANHAPKSAAASGPRRRQSRAPKADALPQRSSVHATDIVFEPLRPIRKSAKSARPAELLSIPKQSKADLINWSTTATANKRLKTCGTPTKLSGKQASSPVAQPPGASAGLQTGSPPAQACRDSMHVRLPRLPSAILRPFWPNPNHLLSPGSRIQRPANLQKFPFSFQQTSHKPPAPSDAVNNASQPAVADSLASHAVEAAQTGTDVPAPAHLASNGSSPQEPAQQQQQPLLQLPDACDQPEPRKGTQRPGLCIAKDMDTAAQELAALLQGPQPLLPGVVHAFGHAICACSAVLPGCEAAQRQLRTKDSASQDHQSAATDQGQMVGPELHPLALLWLSTAALSGFSLTALLHLACRVDEILCGGAQRDQDQLQIAASGAQQTSGQAQMPAGSNKSSPAIICKEGMFLEELRSHLHSKALVSLAAGHCSRPRDAEPLQLQSRPGAAAEPALNLKQISGLADACQGQRTPHSSRLRIPQCRPNAALDAEQGKSCDVSAQSQLCAARSVSICAAAMQSSNSAPAVAMQCAAAHLAAPPLLVNPPEASVQPESGIDERGLGCKHTVADQSAATALTDPAALTSSIQPHPMPAITGAGEAPGGGQQGTPALSLQGPDQSAIPLTANISWSSIQPKPVSPSAGAAQRVEGPSRADTSPPSLPSTSAPVAQSAPLRVAGHSLAAIVTECAADAAKANNTGSSCPSPLSTLDSQHAAVLCLASGSLCKIVGNRQVDRLLNRQHALLVQCHSLAHL